MNEYVELSMKEFGLDPLHHVSLPGYTFDCWLMSSGVTLDTLQDKQMLDDFVETKRVGICVIMGDRFINIGNGNGAGNSNDNDNGNNNSNSNSNSSIWYVDANNLYG